MQAISEYDFECGMLISEIVEIFDRAYFWETVTISVELEMTC